MFNGVAEMKGGSGSSRQFSIRINKKKMIEKNSNVRMERARPKVYVPTSITLKYSVDNRPNY